MTTMQPGAQLMTQDKINLDKKTDIISLEETTAIYNLIYYYERGKNYAIYSW